VAGETGRDPVARADLAAALPGRSLGAGVRLARRRGLVERVGGAMTLTDPGRRAGAELVRRHRLWESYLVERAGLPPDHVHEPAERLEHLDEAPAGGPALDPHGRPIPGAPDASGAADRGVDG
jgi:Mn-dependent DtxR family transcriptional regulator